jgi:site-specific DNA-methyltransferase (adenine-specific)
MSSIKILQGNCLDRLRDLPEKSVNTCVTSPPYWGLRDYGTGEWQGGDPDCPHMRTTKISKDTSTGHKGMFEQGNVVGDAIYKTECPKCGATRKDEQLGLEETPEQFTENLVKLFREVRRVLRDDGTVWLNLGDSYSSGGRKTTNNQDLRGDKEYGVTRPKPSKGIKEKDLIGIPWRVAFALQADGWYLRQDIIWHKPNPMPESVQDRCTKAHEYIFLLSKSPKYYYDNEAIKEESQSDASETKNKRSVWSVSPVAYKEAHFATYPPELIKPCILAGCPEGGTVLDPFGGSGTTAQVSNNLNRNAILCELNPEYVEIAKGRLQESLGMFLDMEIL